MGIKHFSSRKKYLGWLAYGHVSGEFESTPGSQKIIIHGKSHKVNHRRR